MNIRLLSHSEIDYESYDRCLMHSLQGTVYALSWYLDIVSPGWELLATEDYSYVMPLPVKHKLGFTYIIQPPLCQQLGLFSGKLPGKSVLDAFVREIPHKYCLLHLNAGNSFADESLEQRPNQILALNETYPELKKKYSRNGINILKKLEKQTFSLDKDLDIETFRSFLSDNSGYYTGKINELIQVILPEAIKRGCGKIWGVRTENSPELLAAVFLLHWKNRFYYFVPVSSSDGKKANAMRFLIDQFIREYASSEFTLDFEGSSIPSVSNFYSSFGAILEPYPRYIHNAFPWPVNILFDKKTGAV